MCCELRILCGNESSPKTLVKCPVYVCSCCVYVVSRENRRAACADSLLYPLFRGPGGKRQIIMNVGAFSPLSLVYILHPAERERERSRIRGHLWFFSPLLFPHSLFSFILLLSSFFSSSLSIPLWVCCSHLLYISTTEETYQSRSFLIFLFFFFFGGKSIL